MISRFFSISCKSAGGSVLRRKGTILMETKLEIYIGFAFFDKLNQYFLVSHLIYDAVRKEVQFYNHQSDPYKT